MNHIKALGIKFIVISIIVFSLFSIFNFAVFDNLLLISLTATIVTYLLGDMLILKKLGNVTATLSDFALSFFLYWILGSLFFGMSAAITLTSLTAAFFTTIAEPFIHVYIQNQVFSNDKKDTPKSFRHVQTEFADEMELGRRNKKDYEARKKRD
ncbi:YndM family protein [Virgibacillus oceani]